MSAARPPTNRPWRGARDAAHAWMLVGVALLAACVGVIGLLTGAWNAVENASVDARFSLRPVHQPHNLVVVGIDEKTLDALNSHWPFPRSLDARAIEVLRADHARTIVYDVQFTKPTSEAQDRALFRAVARAGNVVLATTELGAHGRGEVLGGSDSLARADATVAAADFSANSSGVIQQYPYSVGGLDSVAVATAEAATGRPPPSSSFRDGSAWIDFPGPVGTVPSVSFVDLVHGRVPPAELAGKIVVVGATSAGAAGHPRHLGDLQHGHVGPGSAGRCDRDGAGRQPAAPDPAVGGRDHHRAGRAGHAAELPDDPPGAGARDGRRAGGRLRRAGPDRLPAGPDPAAQLPAGGARDRNPRGAAGELPGRDLGTRARPTATGRCSRTPSANARPSCTTPRSR